MGLSFPMGSHYNSIHVRHADHLAVVATVETLLSKNKSGRLLIGPPFNGWVGVYPDDAVGAEDFSAALSDRLQTTVLGLVLHDSSLIIYNHFHAGKLADEYSSDPDYFEKVSPMDHERLKGKPDCLPSLSIPLPKSRRSRPSWPAINRGNMFLKTIGFKSL